MTKDKNERIWHRRGFQQCMGWLGTGVILTLAGGVLKGIPISQAAHGAQQGAGGLRFVRVADVPPEGGEQAADDTHAVVDNFSSAPATATVPVGKTVPWTNRDEFPHKVVNPGQKFKSRVLDTDGGVAIVAPVLMAYGPAAAGQPIHEVQIVASRYTFEPASIQVEAGESVRLVVRSRDGMHGFAIPTLNIDLHIPDSGEPATVDFTAPAAGVYDIACSEFCGRGHGQMRAALVSTGAPRTSR
jgi:cytochrome c oxidase subunit II